jgi:hypothetical protein
MITVFAYVTAGYSAVAALTTLWLSLPGDDLAREGPMLLLFLDPFVLFITGPLAFVGATVSLPVAIWALQGTDIGKSIPRVGAVTILCAAITGPGSLLAVPATLIAGVIAMFWVRSNPACRLR